MARDTTPVEELRLIMELYTVGFKSLPLVEVTAARRNVCGQVTRPGTSKMAVLLNKSMLRVGARFGSLVFNMLTMTGAALNLIPANKQGCNSAASLNIGENT